MGLCGHPGSKLEHMSLCLWTDHTASISHSWYMVVSLFLLVLLWWRNLKTCMYHFGYHCCNTSLVVEVMYVVYMKILEAGDLECFSLWVNHIMPGVLPASFFGVSTRISDIFPGSRNSSIPGKKILSGFKATHAKGSPSLIQLLSLSSSTYWIDYSPVIQNNLQAPMPSYSQLGFHLKP